MSVLCTLPLEEGEACFSHLIRLCRVLDIELESVVGKSTAVDATGLRDFPLTVNALESTLGFHFCQREILLSHHSSALYFADMIPEPFRAELLSRCFSKIGDAFRISVATRWQHLRYCPQCAKSEYRSNYFSWWHRDHQLPLMTFCLAHEYPLVDLGLSQLRMQLPHELAVKSEKVRDRVLRPLPCCRHVANLELSLAHGGSNLTTHVEVACRRVAKNCGNKDDQVDFAFGTIMDMLSSFGTYCPGRALEDRDAIFTALKSLIWNGVDFSDPAVAVLLSAALGPSHPLK